MQGSAGTKGSAAGAIAVHQRLVAVPHAGPVASDATSRSAIMLPDVVQSLPADAGDAVLPFSAGLGLAWNVTT